MKIKIIDLLNKIANGEETINVKTKYDSLGWKENDFLSSIYYEFNSRTNAEIVEFLNDYVEIIEEPKKINKIRIDYNSINIDKAFETGTTTFFREKDIEIFQCLSSKINELIDEINNLKDE